MHEREVAGATRRSLRAINRGQHGVVSKASGCGGNGPAAAGQRVRQRMHGRVQGTWRPASLPRHDCGERVRRGASGLPPQGQRGENGDARKPLQLPTPAWLRRGGKRARTGDDRVSRLRHGRASLVRVAACRRGEGHGGEEGESAGGVVGGFRGGNHLVKSELRWSGAISCALVSMRRADQTVTAACSVCLCVCTVTQSRSDQVFRTF